MYEFTIPANTTAEVRLPAKDAAQVTEVGKALTAAPGVKVGKGTGDEVVLEVSAGKYVFRVARVRPGSLHPGVAEGTRR